MEDKDNLVTFTFSCSEYESVNLKLRLKYDNLTQTDFFRYILNMYIENNPEMMDLVSKIKLGLSTMGRRKIKKARRDLATGQDLLVDLGITASDKQDIFDLIENNNEGDYD